MVILIILVYKRTYVDSVSYVKCLLGKSFSMKFASQQLTFENIKASERIKRVLTV